MYQTHFQLKDRPFPAAPVVRRYFPASAIEQARQTLARTIERAEGPALLVGPAGTGKTLLCRLLADQFRSRLRVAMLATGRLGTRRALLQNILFELRLPYRDMDDGELRLSLVDHLTAGQICPQGMLLLVDEAHALPLRLLEELRLITNLVGDGGPRVRLILAGGDPLEEKFASPKLNLFNQRIAARCYLDALNRDETIGYVRAQITAVGGDPEQIFDEQALVAVHRATDGIPRLINQLCDHALILAAAGGKRHLNAAGIEEAWADLQHLPTPWGKPDEVLPFVSGEPAESHVIEFGPLDADPSGPTLQRDSIDGLAPCSEETEPAERLDQIAQQIDEVTQHDDAPRDPTVAERPDSGAPAPERAQRPEIELVVNDPAASLEEAAFDQEFDEEELVVDPYAALDADRFRQRQLVYNSEAHEIATAVSKLLTEQQQASLAAGMPAPEPAAAPDVAVVESRDGDVHRFDPGSDRAVLQEQDEGSDLPSSEPASARAEPSGDDRAEEAAEQASDAPSPGCEVASSQACLQALQAPSDFDGRTDGDRELIIVEDDGSEVPARKPIRAPRKSPCQHYRQLFAQLRRGG